MCPAHPQTKPPQVLESPVVNSRHPYLPSRNGSRNGARRARPLSTLSDDELLKLRMRDLNLRIERTELHARIKRLYGELEARGIHFRPHFWLSDEWFSPDGIPGIAVPFYLAHPRLVRLERKQMLEVEGGTEDWCMRILRHEMGHVLDTAYRLHLRRRYRELFGRYTAPYPEHYYPRPYSKNFVLHLEPSYAQAHPAEDFAETFAVWLKPRSPWRTSYEGWPVLKKLEYVDELMEEIRDQAPRVVSRSVVEPLRGMRKTLAEHYAAKRERYKTQLPNLYDQHLRKLFSNGPEYRRHPSASGFLRRHRVELRRDVAAWTGEYQYTIDQVLGEMIRRCRELKLRLDRSVQQTKREALILVTVQTMKFLHGGHHRVAM